ncbi:hypothetical protein [Photobacterium galatheae]|uniref:Porin domain-containing protein n=1 Tax=Photobacterium galatheae TaxID=1654360 RepID=A0A066RU98_9GAMM|nr:hypothetical protein [Photobacterium galatheae]KDM90968.1 hypothetical protein EA58_14530 [Photobacterium galatheae]MCM0149074.1 hypothetical protein [Photobacterium galatheae]
MLKKTIISLTVIAAMSAPAFAADAVKQTKEKPSLSLDYKIWFQDHETVGKRYVSAQNNLLKATAHTQNGLIPNVSIQIGKAESNLFEYTNTDIRAFYVYDATENLSFDYGAGVSMRYDARHGKQDDPTTLDWDANDPHVALGVSYKLPQFQGLTLFSEFEKRFSEDNESFSGGTTSEFGMRYAFVDKGSRRLSAEIGYRRDIQDAAFTVTKTADGSDVGGASFTAKENRRMISDGFYLGVNMSF